MQTINELTYLEKGLTGLAGASNIDWFSGHFGAAVLAAEFFISECNLDKNIVPLVQIQTEKIIERYPHLFKKLGGDEYESKWEDKIISQLQKNTKNLRNGAHGVIYGVLALKALHANNKFASKEIVNGIVKLLELSSADAFERYYGIPDYTIVKVETSDGIPEYKSNVDFIRASFSELNVIYQDETINGKCYFFAGGKIHGVTHAHAISILEELGYKELARGAYENHRLHLKLNRQSPPDPKKINFIRRLFPHERDYWMRDFNEPHFIKFPYSVLSLLRYLPKEEHNECLHKSSVWWSQNI